MLLKNVKVQRPGSTKIQRKNGIAYVYQVTGKSYKKDKKYTVDERKLIGRMIDDTWMIPNEFFSQYYPEVNIEQEAPDFSDTLKTGSFLLIQKIMKDLEIDKLLDSVFGDTGPVIEDIVSYMITNESCTFQYYPNFMKNHPILCEKIMDDTQISRLFKHGIKEENIQMFMKAWNQMNNVEDYIYLGYDSTNFNTSSDGIELADYGHPKVDEGLPQYNLSYSVRQEDSRPLFYELYDGSVIDNTQLLTMVEAAKDYGYEKIGFLMDRGYVSESNVRKMARNGCQYILMLKSNQTVCQELIKKYGASIKTLEGYFINDHDVYGTTAKGKLYGEEVYFHIYYDDVRASEEKVALLSQYNRWEKELDKKVEKKTVVEGELVKYRKAFQLKYDINGYFQSYKRNSRYIKEELNERGFFFIVTSEEMSAEKALDMYRGRDNIEKMFRSLKSGIDFNKCRVATTEALQSKVFITFIAMIIRNEIFQKTQVIRKKNRKYYTVPGILYELENVESTRDSREKYRRRYALTAKQKTIFKQFGIDEKYIDKRIAEFTY